VMPGPPKRNVGTYLLHHSAGPELDFWSNLSLNLGRSWPFSIIPEGN